MNGLVVDDGMGGPWSEWRASVIAVIRTEYHELFPSLQQDEIDWDAWKPLYEEGYTPQIAVALALSTDGMEDTAPTSVVNNGQ